MLLRELIETINILSFKGNMDIQIRGLSCDSQKVKEGDLFIAIKGFKTDGHLFLNDAIKKGASALVIEDKSIWNEPWFMNLEKQDVCLCLTENSRFALAVIADKFYGYPSRNLHLIGVTGTNGKTTTCTLISSILKAAGEKIGWITTLEYRIGEDSIQAQRTTPESLYLHFYLSKILEAGCRWAVLEVSSHSLALDRVVGCWFDAAVLTNITHDHMDFHKTTRGYQGAKIHLLNMLDQVTLISKTDKVAVLNVDDQVSRKIIDMRRSKQSKSLTITYGIGNKADVMAKDINEEKSGFSFNAITPWGNICIESCLLGRPNIYNVLTAISVALIFGINKKDIKEGIKAVSGVPGRFEKILLGQPFDVIVDYAHTDDALLNLLSTIRKYTVGRLICVFGCGGERDKNKRPLMGQVAAQWSDFTILTTDNPRGENPASIIRQIENGFLKKGSQEGYEICLDRKEAIYRAISQARPKDVVVIAGKGHETTQVIGNKVYPFDDCEVAKQAITDSMRQRGL